MLYEVCPECGHRLEYGSGCCCCPECGWSACGKIIKERKINV
jgi:hypothetical protein